MGSLSSSPKAPAQPQVVYVPAPAPVTSNTVTETKPEKTQEEQAAEAREKSLLSRKRGRFGTIATSLQGFLDGRGESGRKTLLGE